MNLLPTCRCGHPPHDGKCAHCVHDEYLPDDHVYPAGPMVAT